MPEPIPEPRESKKQQVRIEELERVVKILVKAVMALEEEAEVYTIPKGEYYGEKAE